MCNYFGNGCPADPLGTYHSNNPEGMRAMTEQELKDKALKDAPGMVNAYRLRKPPTRLTQSDIDRPLPSVSRREASWREALDYLDGEPGGVLTTIVIIVLFLVAMWGIWAAWQLPIVGIVLGEVMQSLGLNVALIELDHDSAAKLIDALAAY